MLLEINSPRPVPPISDEDANFWNSLGITSGSTPLPPSLTFMTTLSPSLCAEMSMVQLWANLDALRADAPHLLSANCVLVTTATLDAHFWAVRQAAGPATTGLRQLQLQRPLRLSRHNVPTCHLSRASSPWQFIKLADSFNTDLLQLHRMDARVKRAVLSKIDEAIEGAGEISEIRQSLDVQVSSPQDFALGIAVGRIYNSFHYQTRRALGRNAEPAEFSEFLEILSSRMADLRRACQ